MSPDSGSGLPSNRTDSLPSREENLARRFVDRRRLVPPIDVEKLAEELADVATKSFPVKIDGLCLDIGRAGARPKIWVSDKLPHQRRRFTLAHEIGHIVIPWHSGSIVDDLEASDGSARDDYYQMEGEANRFAAELLMPTDWVQRICAEVEHMRAAMLTIVEVADVSLSAAALRVVTHGPPGYVVAAVRDNLVDWSARTHGTRVRPPPLRLTRDELGTNACEEPQILNYGPVAYYWWKEKNREPAPQKPALPWREILVELTDTVPRDQRAQVRQRLNAIIGLAIGKLPKGSPVEELYQRAIEALTNRSDDIQLRASMAHPLFMSYVLARVYERSES
jgi:IrrE N-terminal-like domain